VWVGGGGGMGGLGVGWEGDEGSRVEDAVTGANE